MKKEAVALACAAALLVADRPGGSVDVEVPWRYAQFTVDGESQEVVADQNATRTPWVTLDGEEMMGNAGCNHFGGEYQIAGDELTWEGAKNDAWCGPQDGTLMECELAFEDVAWHGPLMEVVVDRDRMVWSNGGDSLEFVAVESIPTTTTVPPPPMTEVGQLDCSPGVVVESPRCD